MPKQSAGILLYRKTPSGPEFFLVHPGGPFFKNKDDGVWSIPKGEFTDDENAFTAAKREFEEETGSAIDGDFIVLIPVKLKSGKTIHAWAVEGNIDHAQITSNIFTIEWPPKSGKMQTFPEIDRAGWFGFEDAKQKINAAQIALLGQILKLL